VSAPLIVVSSLEKTYATRGRAQVHALAGISVEIGDQINKFDRAAIVAHAKAYKP
jgi:hypothetical protein